MPLRYRETGGVLLLSISLFSAGCTTMYRIAPIDAPTPPVRFGRIEVGDMVAVEMKDGRGAKFEVGDIDGDTLVSVSGVRYPRAEMVQLHHENIDPGKVVLVVAAAVGGTIALVLVLEAIGFGGR